VASCLEEFSRSSGPDLTNPDGLLPRRLAPVARAVDGWKRAIDFSPNKGPSFLSLEALSAGTLSQYRSVADVVLCQATKVVVRQRHQGGCGILQ
jgi:hypothetical protein